MRKCPECNGCLRPVWINNKVYRYCDIPCRAYYRTENGKVFKMSDEAIEKEKEIERTEWEKRRTER